ncbi:hypothetical protein BH11ACT3_BH11ACT3_24430 [soil metagenome]
MDGDELSHRWRRFRAFMTRALRPLQLILPIGLVVASAGFLVDREADGGLGNFVAIVIVSAIFFGGMVVLVRLFEARRDHHGTEWLSRRDSVLLAALTAFAIYWLTGVAGLPGLPDGPAGIVISAFINGMFGVVITLGLLIASVGRRPRPSGPASDHPDLER